MWIALTVIAAPVLALSIIAMGLAAFTLAVPAVFLAVYALEWSVLAALNVRLDFLRLGVLYYLTVAPLMLAFSGGGAGSERFFVPALIAGTIVLGVVVLNHYTFKLAIPPSALIVHFLICFLVFAALYSSENKLT